MSAALSIQASSGRCRAPKETLEHARQLAPIAGISEVRELTGPDHFGVHVFAAVRPRSLSDSVTFGKGSNATDAEVGAIMEGIEFYFAEPGASEVETLWGSAHDLAAGQTPEEAIHQFIPLHGKRPDSDAPLLLARARDLESGAESLVPAELVFRPAPDPGQKLFGSTTNGLASGNSIEEASRFALFELIERDIWSLELARQRSMLVDPASLPDELRVIVDRIKGQGLGLHVRFVPNDFGLPFFAAFLFDPRDLRFESFNGGWGLAFSPADAAMQSVLEALQGRLGISFRDRNQADRLSRKVAQGDKDRIAQAISAQIDRVRDASSSTSFKDTPDMSASAQDEVQLDSLIRVLRRVTNTPIHQVLYTPSESPLHVVRLIVPELEHYKVERVRVGKRLHAALNNSRAGKPAACDGQHS